MATKKQSNTGFRNGDLFCFNCGASQKMPLPMAIRIAVDLMKSFAKHHKSCLKTWVEPVAPTGKTEKENMQWWMDYGEHGISSETMFNHLSDNRVFNISGCPPSDPDDFRRCSLLLNAVPQFRDKLSVMNKVSPVWANLVSAWSILERLLETKDEGMYVFMKSLGC